jgi:hypothetical protein
MQNIVAALISGVPKGIWFRMLPIDDDDMDIKTATGLKWEDLLPVLLKVNLIKAISKAGEKSYQVDMNGWSHLKATIDTKKSLDWTTA